MCMVYSKTPLIINAPGNLYNDDNANTFVEGRSDITSVFYL